MTQRIISIAAFCLYLAAVAYLCFAKPEDVPHLPEFWFGLPADKAGHFLMFAPFPVLGYMAFCTRHMSIGRQFLLVAGLTAAGVALAIGTEQVQAMLQYRTADTDDLLADAAGILGGLVVTIIYVILKRRA